MGGIYDILFYSDNNNLNRDRLGDVEAGLDRPAEHEGNRPDPSGARQRHQGDGHGHRAVEEATEPTGKEVAMKALKFFMLEGEYIVDMWVEMDCLYIKSNLDRVWKSTNVPVENLDFTEITNEKEF